MARRDAQRLTRRLKDAGTIATTALKQLERVLDEIGDRDLSPADMTTVLRQLDTQTEAIEQRLQQVRAATGALETRAAVGGEPEPMAGRRTGRTRSRPPEAGGAIPPRRKGRGPTAAAAKAKGAAAGGIPGPRRTGAAGGIPGRG
jgi:hypothetical protein